MVKGTARVRSPVEQVQFQPFGNQTAKGRRIHPPLREKQIAPPHPHHPRAIGNRPGRVIAGMAHERNRSFQSGCGRVQISSRPNSR